MLDLLKKFKAIILAFLLIATGVSTTFIGDVDPPSNDTGWNLPSTTGNTDIGYVSWTTGNDDGTDDDGNFVQVQLDEIQQNHDFSDYWDSQNFGLSIPTDATIDGIEVEVQRKESTHNPEVYDEKIMLLDETGSEVGNNKADTTDEWATTEESKYYGGSSDTWSWTDVAPSDLNDVDFGVRVRVDGDNFGLFETIIALIDCVQVKVYYTEATNLAPVVSNASPANNSYVDTSLSELSAYIEDPEGDFSGSYSIECTNGDSKTDSLSSNGTYSLSLSSGLSENTIYYWWVNATDSKEAGTSEKYSFDTHIPDILVLYNGSDDDETFANDFADWKKGNSSYTVFTKDVQDILSDSNYWVNGTWGDGNSNNPFYISQTISNYSLYNQSQHKIRNYIRRFAHGGTEYVILMGGKNRFPFWQNFSSDNSWGEGKVPMDILFYGCLNGTQNSYDNQTDYGANDTQNGAGIQDENPDIIPSRMDYRNNSQWYNIFNKTKIYPTLSYDDEKAKNWVFVRDTNLEDSCKEKQWTESQIYYSPIYQYNYSNTINDPLDGYCSCEGRILRNFINYTQWDIIEEYLNGDKTGWTDGFSLYYTSTHTNGGFSDGTDLHNTLTDKTKTYYRMHTGCNIGSYTHENRNHINIVRSFAECEGGNVFWGGPSTYGYFGDLKYPLKELFRGNRTLGKIETSGFEQYADKRPIDFHGQTLGHRSLNLFGDPTLRFKYPDEPSCIMHDYPLHKNSYPPVSSQNVNITPYDFNGDNIDTLEIRSNSNSGWSTEESWNGISSGTNLNTTVTFPSEFNTTFLWSINISDGTYWTNFSYEGHTDEGYYPSVDYIENLDSYNLTPNLIAHFNDTGTVYWRGINKTTGEWQTLQTSTISELNKRVSLSNFTLFESYNQTYKMSLNTTNEVDWWSNYTFYYRPISLMFSDVKKEVPDADLSVEMEHNTGTTNYECIDDGNNFDGNTTYIYPPSSGSYEIYTDNYSFSNPQMNASISHIAFQVTTYIDSEYESFDLFLKDSTTDIKLMDDFRPEGKWQNNTFNLTCNPITGEKWTWNNLDDINISLKHSYKFKPPDMRYSRISMDIYNNKPPIQNNSIPSNESTFTLSNAPSELSVDISDPEGDNFDWTIETTPNIGSSSGNNENNGTKTCSVSVTDYGQHKWYVNTTDGYEWNNETYTFTVVFQETIRNNGIDFFTFRGQNTTASYFVENITGFDESSEHIAVWNDTTWNDGMWVKYNGDGTGTDFNLNILDVIRVYLTDSSTQTIVMIPDATFNYETSKTYQWMNSTNKGFNYTGKNTPSGTTLSDINASVTLQKGEGLALWDNTNYEWKYYLPYVYEPSVSVAQWDVIWSKVEDTETWNT